MILNVKLKFDFSSLFVKGNIYYNDAAAIMEIFIFSNEDNMVLDTFVKNSV